jgi:cell division protein FtsW
MARTLKSDKVLFWGALALVCTSIVMVFSASALNKAAGPPLSQLGWAVAGIGALLVMMRVDYHHLRRPAVIWSLVAFTIGALLAVFFFEERNGARRWIEVAGRTWQPSELAKLAAIIFAAAVLDRRMHRINDVGYSLAPIAVVTGVLAFLIVIEPDLGTSTVLVLVVVSMVFAAGLRWRYLGGGVLLMLPVLVYFIVAFPWRWARIMAFMDPTVGRLKENYQLEQSTIALGSGGPFGLGLGNGMQKVFFLPEPHNDFIFAVIGEELGLIGTTAILACFAVIAWRGLRAALLAPDRFGTLLGIGIAMMVGLQAFLNMSVVTGLAPTKGIPLPLVSAGGSSLVVTLLAMGILLNISQQASSTAAASVDSR